MAAELSVMLGLSILQALGPKWTEQLEIFRWVDSLITYYWIRTDRTKLLTFPANRVKTIQENSKTSEWRFIAGKENPADLCSRGVSAAALADPEGIWWKSAAWLSLPQSEWPSEQVDDSPEEMDAYRLEFKKDKTLSAPAVAERLEDEDDEAPEFEAGV